MLNLTAHLRSDSPSDPITLSGSIGRRPGFTRLSACADGSCNCFDDDDYGDRDDSERDLYDDWDSFDDNPEWFDEDDSYYYGDDEFGDELTDADAEIEAYLNSRDASAFNTADANSEDRFSSKCPKRGLRREQTSRRHNRHMRLVLAKLPPALKEKLIREGTYVDFIDRVYKYYRGEKPYNGKRRMRRYVDNRRSKNDALLEVNLAGAMMLEDRFSYTA